MTTREEANTAIRETVEWWDMLPKGFYTPRTVNDWLNSSECKKAILKLKAIVKAEDK